MTENMMWLLDTLAGEVRRLRDTVETMHRNNQQTKDAVVAEAKKAGATEDVVKAINALWSDK